MEPTAKTDDSNAKRVELFRTQAVGIVDKAANGEEFLALKSMDGQPDTAAGAPPAEAQKAPPAEPPPVVLKMPAAAKAAMTEALGAAIDTCVKMAEALQGAEVDDAAPVPTELIQMALMAEEQLGAIVDPYEEAMMAMGPPPPEGAPAQKAATAPVVKMRRRMAMKRILEMDGVSKALTESAAKVSEMVAWAKGTAGMPPPSAGLDPAKKADLDPYTAMDATARAVKERMYYIRDMLESDPAGVANELRQLIPQVDNLAQLVTQARSGAMMQPPGGAPAAAPAAVVSPQQVEETAMAVTKALAKVKDELVESLKADLAGPVLAAKGAAATIQAALVKAEKAIPVPQGRPAGENNNTPPIAAPPADPWRSVNADIQQARSGAAGK